MTRRIALTVALLSASACAQDAPVDAETRPVDIAVDVAPPSAPETAQRWAPGLHSPNGSTYTPALTPDGRTAFVVRWDAPDYKDPTSIQRLYRTTWDEEAGAWGELSPVLETAGWRVDFPHVTPDGRRLLLSTNKPHDGHFQYPDGRPSDDFDLWQADLSTDGEIVPGTFRPMRGADLNRQKTPDVARIGYVHNETSPRTDREGALLFWTERLDDGGGRRDAYRAASDGGGGYSAPDLLPFNTRRQESGVAVDPDGRFVIFSSEGRGGAGGSDLFVVARDGDGWGEPVPLGPVVNTAAGEDNPQISADGRTLWFTTGRRVPGVADVDDGENVGPPAQVFWIDLRAVPAVRDLLGER